MKKYHYNLDRYLDRIHVFDYSQIPVERDLFILGEDDFARNREKWVAYLEGTHEQHPNHYMKYIHGYCKFAQNTILDVFTEINIFDRFHGVCKKLIERDFRYCFQYYSSGERPFIIVSQMWIDNLKSDIYASYAMIDIIGVKKYLEENGTIDKERITHYKTQIDSIASENSNYIFVTFTDNIFIKCNWMASNPDYNSTYTPEHLFLIIKKIQNIIFKIFNLKSYAIVTQGRELFENDELLHINSKNNHFFIGSISTPFIELFDIDESVKEHIKKDSTYKQNLYLSETCFLSLKFKTNDIERNKIGVEFKLIKNNSGVSMDSFYSIDLDKIIDLIEYDIK